MIIRTNTLTSLFTKADHNVKYKLFKSHCMSLYGSQLFDMSFKCTNQLFTVWRKCLRKFLQLPPTTHCNLIPLICDDIPISLQLYKRFMKFFVNSLGSTNECVKICTMSALNGSGSTTCNNINVISHLLGMDKYSISRLPIMSILKLIQSHHMPAKYLCITAGQIRDLMYLRSTHYEHFSYNDFDTMLQFLCTD